MLQVITFQAATLRLKNSIHRSPLRRVFFLIPVALALFAFVPASRAVSPAPDGGYANGNTAEGSFALQSLTIGVNNTALGFGALLSNMLGTHNTANGFVALFSNSADDNTAVGWAALAANTIGTHNTANGSGALNSNTEGEDNTALGFQALVNNTTISGVSGNENTADGFQALVSNTTGNANTAVGWEALSANTTGFANIALGPEAGDAVSAANHVICIGAHGQNVSNSCYIGQIFGATSSGGIGVFVNSDGKLGTTTSSKRFKDEIKPMDKASEALLALKPVTFRYKKEIDPVGTPQFGLVAEEVEKVNPDLVVRDKEGKPYSVRYDQVNAMLLNEFLKEHRKVEEQEATITQSNAAKQESTIALQQQEIKALTASLKEQASKIQKVSNQLELNKPAPGVVVNDR